MSAVSVKPGHIDSYLNVLRNRDQEHWDWRRSGDAAATYWMIRYTGFSPPCTFRIQLNLQTICLQANFRNLKVYPECRTVLYRFMLRLNEELSAAKFGISRQGEISLMIDWPAANLNFPTFDLVVQLLLRYYQTYYTDIQLVAQDMELRDYLADLDPLSKEDGVEIEFEREAQP